MSESTTYATFEQAFEALDARNAAKAEDSTPAENDAGEEDVVVGETDEPAQPDDQAEEDEPGEGDDQETDENPADSLAEIDLDGKKYKVAAELRDAFLRQSDYTRKTQAVAAEREQIQSVRQELINQTQQMQSTQNAILSFMSHTIGEPPSLQLAQEDFQRYTIERGLYEQRAAAMQHLMQQGQQVSAHQQQISQQAAIELTQREASVMLEKMPELADPRSYQEFATKAVETGSFYGFTAEEIGGIQDHRMILVLRDLARLQRESKSRQQIAGDVKQKLANVPPKLAKPGATSQNQSKNSTAAKAKAKFMSSDRSVRAMAEWARSAGD